MAWSITGMLMPRWPKESSCRWTGPAPGPGSDCWQMPNNGIGLEHLAGDADDVVGGGRITGPLDRNTPSGLRSAISIESAPPTAQHVAAYYAAAGEVRGVLVLIPVDGRHGEPPLAERLDHVPAFGGHLTGQVGAAWTAGYAPRHQLIGVGRAHAGEHPTAFIRAGAAQMPGPPRGCRSRRSPTMPWRTSSSSSVPVRQFDARGDGIPDSGVAGGRSCRRAARRHSAVPADVADLRRGGDDDHNGDSSWVGQGFW